MPVEARWQEFTRQLNTLDETARGNVPDFLIVSPPRTGSTWLAVTLARHPKLFVSMEPKEIKYFSNHWVREDLSWYLGHFRAAAGRKKGEASPSYSILPTRMIEAVRALAPDLKVIYLMRDPIERAWSHAKHAFTYREHLFKDVAGDFEAVTAETFLAAATHEWTLSQGDYLSALQRWHQVFPRSQMFVEFYESIRDDPHGLLNRLTSFLGVDPLTEGDDAVRAVINAERAVPLPAPLRASLSMVFRDRTDQLRMYLLDKFALSTPACWRNSALENDSSESSPLRTALVSLAARLNDPTLERILATDESFPPVELVVQGHRGFNIVKHRGRYLALAQSLGPTDLDRIDAASLADLYRAGGGSSAQEVIERIDALNAAASAATGQEPTLLAE